jgi:hypothetical protein
MKALEIGGSVIENLFHGVELSDSHLILGKGSSLICADLIGTAHSLRGGKLTHPVVLFLHLHHREGEGDGDGKWETFRDGNNDNCDGSDQGIQEIINSLAVPFLCLKDTSIKDTSAKTEDKTEAEEFETNGCKLVGNAIELLLERSCLLLSLQLFFGLA